MLHKLKKKKNYEKGLSSKKKKFKEEVQGFKWLKDKLTETDENKLTELWNTTEILFKKPLGKMKNNAEFDWKHSKKKCLIGKHSKWNKKVKDEDYRCEKPRRNIRYIFRVTKEENKTKRKYTLNMI